MTTAHLLSDAIEKAIRALREMEPDALVIADELEHTQSQAWCDACYGPLETGHLIDRGQFFCSRACRDEVSKADAFAAQVCENRGLEAA